MTIGIVAHTIERCGGIIQTAAVAGLTPEAIYQARTPGRFLQAVACVKLARHLEPTDVVAQMALVAGFAGLPA